MPDMREFAPIAMPGPSPLGDRQRDLASRRRVPPRHDPPASSGVQKHEAQRACPPAGAGNVRWENVGLVAALLVASLWGGVIVLWWSALR